MSSHAVRAGLGLALLGAVLTAAPATGAPCRSQVLDPRSDYDWAATGQPPPGDPDAATLDLRSLDVRADRRMFTALFGLGAVPSAEEALLGQRTWRLVFDNGPNGFVLFAHQQDGAFTSEVYWEYGERTEVGPASSSSVPSRRLEARLALDSRARTLRLSVPRTWFDQFGGLQPRVRFYGQSFAGPPGASSSVDHAREPRTRFTYLVGDRSCA